MSTVTTVDMATGAVVASQTNAMQLLPPAGDKCQECAVAHAWDQPHNQESLYYQMQFHAKHGRYPTWSDAMQHCPDTVKSLWRTGLRTVLTNLSRPIPDDLKPELDGPGSTPGAR